MGTSAPPIKPCSARKTIIAPRLVAKAQRTLVTVKPSAEITNMTRVDSSRDNVPESGIMTISAIRYEVCTQAISSELADNPPWIWVSELVTIWISISAMNMPKTMARMPSQSRTVGTRAGAPVGLGAGPCAPAAAATRAASSSRVGGTWSGCRPGLRGGDNTVTCLAGLDGHRGRKTGAQQPGERPTCRESNPHRNALDDLGEIPGCVVGRQQAELGAAGRGEALDPPLERHIRVGVDRHLGDLPRPHSGQLCLLEIGRDVDLQQRH